MSLNYGNSTISIKNSIPVINWALFNSRANTDSATASEPAVGQCLFARYYSSLNAGTPSFLLIPSRFKSGKLYAQIPTNGSGDLNVTRSLDTATRVNASGFIVSVASGIPRLDYFASGGTVGCPALLVEPSATNGIRNNSMVNAVAGTPGALPTNWSNQLGGGITQTIVGTGTENGVSYIDIRFSGTQNNATPTDIRFESTTQIVASNGQTWSESVWLKIVAAPNPPTDYRLYMFERDSGGVFIKSATQVASLTTTLTRYSFTRALDGGATVAIVQPALTFTTANGSTYDFTIRIGYPQMEQSSVATSVIPTTTGSVTRNADVISSSGNVSGSIGQTEGSIYAEVNIQKLLGTTQRAIVDIGQAGNRLFLGYGNGLTNQIRFLLQTSGGGFVDFQSAATTTGTIRVAVGYKNSDSAMYVNGVNVTPTSNGSFTATLTTLSNIYIGSSLNGLDFLNDKINKISLFSTRLTNTALQNMTIQ